MNIKKRIKAKYLERGMVIIDPHNRKGTIETIGINLRWDTFKKREDLFYRVGIKYIERIEYFYYTHDNIVEAYLPKGYSNPYIKFYV